MANGFTRQIRGFGGSTSNTTNNTNTTSDNYSYYVKSEEQESYKRKNAEWNPGRSFADQHKENMKQNNATFADPMSCFLKDASATDMPGVSIYPSTEYNSKAGITSLDPTTGASELSSFEESLLVKRGLKTIKVDNSFMARYSGPIFKIALLISICIMATMLITDSPKDKNKEEKYYYDEIDL